jgi:general secretion pathway protein A
MYESFYGLRERPFDLTPNPRFLFLTGKHREALSSIEYGILGRKGIALLIGEAGTGKTTLIRAALDGVRRPGACIVYVSNPTLTREEFYEFLASGYGLSPHAAESKAAFLVELEESVQARHRAGGFTALIIDEAQSLPHDLMEEIRLLANLETATDKLLPAVIAGQPELAERLNDPTLRQLKQRVALRCDLAPLDIQETAAYIAGRIRIAGGDITRVFTRDAVATIHERSRGIPRTISVICDNALVNGFAADLKPVGRAIVLEVCRDFHFEPFRPSEGLTVPPVGPEMQSRAQSAPSAAPKVMLATEDGIQALTTRLREVRQPKAAAPSSSPAEHPDRAVARSAPLFDHFTRRRRFTFF